MPSYSSKGSFSSMPNPHFDDVRRSGNVSFACFVDGCYTHYDSLEALLQHAKTFRPLGRHKHKTVLDHLFLTKIMQDRTCTLVGCGKMTEDFLELFDHLKERHNWAWAWRNDPRFKYTFRTDTLGPHAFGEPLSVPESSRNGPASVLPPPRVNYPTETTPLLQSHQGNFGTIPWVPPFSSSDLQHATAVRNRRRQMQEEHREPGNDPVVPRKSNKTETHYSDDKSPKAEDSEKFFSIGDFPKSREEVNIVQKLLGPARMQYTYLTGEAFFVCDDLSNCYLLEWHDMQMSLEYWWHNNGKTSKVPELIFSIIDSSTEKVVWTYEWDAQIFGPVPDLKDLVRNQEFKKLSPIMPECIAG